MFNLLDEYRQGKMRIKKPAFDGLALNEFALQSLPYTYYAWAKKTKPRIPSDERHRQKLNGFLTIDVQRVLTLTSNAPLKKPQWSSCSLCWFIYKKDSAS